VGDSPVGIIAVVEAADEAQTATAIGAIVFAALVIGIVPNSLSKDYPARSTGAEHNLLAAGIVQAVKIFRVV
jgi:hypothetical protein